MDLIRGKESRYDEYEDLLFRRDQLKKEAGQIWTAYIRRFGRLINAVYEEKLECVKRKKAIVYCQTALNRGRKADPAALQTWLQQEMKAYYDNLEKMKADYAACSNAPVVTAYEAQRSKTIYRRLVKRLHPDICPETAKSPRLMELWNRIMTAYAHNDVKELSELEVLAAAALKEIGAVETTVEIPDIEEKIEGVRDEIERIRTTEPYTLRALIESDEAARNKTIALEDELASWQKYKEELNGALKDMIDSGRIDLK